MTAVRSHLNPEHITVNKRWWSNNLYYKPWKSTRWDSRFWSIRIKCSRFCWTWKNCFSYIYCWSRGSLSILLYRVLFSFTPRDDGIFKKLKTQINNIQIIKLLKFLKWLQKSYKKSMKKVVATNKATDDVIQSVVKFLKRKVLKNILKLNL